MKQSDGKAMRSLSDPTRAGLFVAGVYVLVAAAYILFSDYLVELMFPAERISTVQTIKGWAFVIITGGLLAWLVQRRARLIEKRRTHLLTTLHASPLPMYTLDGEGRVRLWSVAAERVLGWTADQVIGEDDPMRCLHGDEQADQRRLAVRNGQRIAGVEIQRLNRNGESRRYLLYVAGLDGDDRHFNGDDGRTLVILQDVTRLRRRQELDIHRRNVSRSLDDFDQAVGVIGHELRTPLASMRASTEVLLSEKLTDPGEVHELLRIVHEQVNRMTEMTNNMLESARLGSGRATWNWSTVPLADICEEAIEIVTPLVDRSRVRLSYDVEPTDLTMQSDFDAIRRLILNLLTNAVRHTPEGEVRIDIQSAEVESQRWIELTVRDTGFGMDRATLERIGEAFASNEGPMNESVVRGAGLGLAICCHLVAAHDGRIAVASRPDEGTRVVVRLAADLAGPADVADPGAIIREVST